MKITKTPIAAAIALVLMGTAAGAHAQSSDTAIAANDPAEAGATRSRDAKKLEQVVVSGISESLARSLEVKRDAASVIEVVTNEDIGKMPDKNVADSLQRVPGVTISSASASEGGFDEADRVSLRGTNPSLTQTLIDGHMVGSGDWFVLNQVGTVGRSVSYSLLPSELVSQVVVHKSSQADLVEGGVAGTVDIQTRRPLYMPTSFTALAEIGGVYADLPDTTDPQFNALVAWKNDAESVGIMLQGFREERHLRRDGQEMLGYGRIAPGSAIATSNPDLSGVLFPNVIGSALFEQERERTGGMVDIQVKPSDNWTLDLNAFTSKLDATNFNRNYLVWVTRLLDGGNGQAPSPGYVVRNGTLVSASFTPQPDRTGVVDDQIYRPGAESETKFVNLDGEWRVNDRLTFTAEIGDSKGEGNTPTQAVFEGDILNTGAAYRLNGTGRPADASVPNGNPAVFTGTTLDWIFGASPGSTDDEESWGKIDGAFALDHGAFTNFKFGFRAANHDRSTVFVAQG
ncbi:MAG TPA: TonB-dependent receptor plug domain-containing protein, partial [Xanthomonadales bacterium]|nr:TonB-dependent receptor plug domain-containing protein [Xanthomonadales bacterium]